MQLCTCMKVQGLLLFNIEIDDRFILLRHTMDHVKNHDVKTYQTIVQSQPETDDGNPAIVSASQSTNVMNWFVDQISSVGC